MEIAEVVEIINTAGTKDLVRIIRTEKTHIRDQIITHCHFSIYYVLGFLARPNPRARYVFYVPLS